MRFKLKVRRGARALVMLIGTDVTFDEFAICPCDPEDFDEALRYAQSRVALPTFLVGGDFAIGAAAHVPNLRGVVAFEATDAVAAARLTVPLLLIGGSRAVSAPDSSRLDSDDERLAVSVAKRFISVYA
jgi:alkylation response protein AidB-like acyl-CoA dehydrogenase